MRYGYLRDPLFVSCVALYFVNRWMLKPLFPCAFVNGYVNDLLCIPFWLPITLYLMRSLKLRGGDGPPDGGEIIVCLLVWSFVFELVVPQLRLFKGVAFTDPLDILAYTVGALLAAVYWRIWYGRSACSQARPRS